MNYFASFVIFFLNKVVLDLPTISKPVLGDVQTTTEGARVATELRVSGEASPGFANFW